MTIETVRASGAKFLGGKLILDFANTISARGGSSERDHIVTYDDLVAWAFRAGLVDERTGESLIQKAARRGPETERTIARARELRDAAHRVFVDVAHSRAADPTDLAVVYAALARAIEHGSIVQAGDGFVWRWQDGAEALDSMLWPIARSAAELLTGADLLRVRECGGDRCGWVFLDQTKNRTRRWCEMKVCGNRAKARRHYHRHRHAAPDSDPSVQ